MTAWIRCPRACRWCGVGTTDRQVGNNNMDMVGVGRIFPPAPPQLRMTTAMKTRRCSHNQPPTVLPRSRLRCIVLLWWGFSLALTPQPWYLRQTGCIKTPALSSSNFPRATPDSRSQPATHPEDGGRFGEPGFSVPRDWAAPESNEERGDPLRHQISTSLSVNRGLHGCSESASADAADSD